MFIIFDFSNFTIDLSFSISLLTFLQLFYRFSISVCKYIVNNKNKKNCTSE